MLSYCSNQFNKLLSRSLQFVIIPLLSIIFVFPLANCTNSYSDTQKSKDQSYHIELDSLSGSWDVKWFLDESSIERLKMLSPEKDVLVRIFAFKGSISFTKFQSIDTLLFGGNFPRPFDTLHVKEYGHSVVRNKYIRRSESGLVIKTDIDLIYWSLSEIDYAYAIVVDYIEDSDSDIGLARSAIHIDPPIDPPIYFPPPPGTLEMIVDFLEALGGVIFPALVIVFLIIAGAWSSIKDISIIKKFLIILFSIASGPIIRYVFGLHWSSMIWVPLVSFFIVSIVVGIISSKY